jgi:MFS family permease
MVPVAVVFAILNQGGSPADVGFVLVAQTVPLAVLVLVGGVVADRLPRRVVMISADLLCAASRGTLAALLLVGRPALWEFMVLLGLSSVGAAFFTPAMTGLIPQVASASRLQQANAMNGLAAAVAQIAGPLAGGVLVAVGSPGLAVAADATSYLVSASCLAAIRVPLTKATGRSPFFVDLRLGWREFRSRTWLWVLTIATGVQGLLVMPPFIVLGAVVAKTDLGGAAVWGLSWPPLAPAW